MYKPHRDNRFEYLWDLMSFIEDNQCRTCAFSKLTYETDKSFAEEYPMCHEVEGELITESPVECLDDRGDDGVVCTAYQNVERAEEAHPDQGRLI